MTGSQLTGHDFSLQGRTVVVTGGAGRLGKRWVEHLKAHGAEIAIFDATGSDSTAPSEDTPPRSETFTSGLRDRAAG